MAVGGDPRAVKRGLEAMSKDPELVREIRELMEEQAAELKTWENAGKRDLIGGIIGGLLGGILGPANGILAGVLSTLPSSVEGSKKFPEPEYPFQPPGPTDQRGPCPGLNALANHGYLPRNGIVTAGQVIRATSQVFNMGADVAAVLVASGIALGGDIQTLRLSIGGANARTNSLGKLGGILGTETGLNGHSHVIESDVSPTRCDFYLCDGDNHNMKPELFAQMLERAKAHGNQFNVAAMAEHFYNRYTDSKSRNPNFYFVPPSALAAMVAHYFHTGFFTNGTIGAGGSSNIASIASFVGAHFKADGSIEYVPERIPEQGWYRRAVPMTLPEVLAGVLAIYANHPVAFGANAGSTDNFIPGPGLLPTNANDVNGLGCFLYNALYASFFGEFQNILFGAEAAMNAVLGLLAPALGDFINCTPNHPNQTGTNAYGGAWKYMNDTAGSPGAPQKQPCLKGNAGSGQCRTNTNTYATTNAVPNRFEFQGTVSAGDNPKP